MCPEGNQTQGLLPEDGCPGHWVILEFWVPLFWPDLHSLQAPCLTYRVDASGAMKSLGLTLLSSMGEVLFSALQSQAALPLQPIPFHRPVCRTNQFGGVFECLLEASWACATKKLLDAEGHLAGPAENPLRASGQRTVTKGMSTGHIFLSVLLAAHGKKAAGMALGLVQGELKGFKENRPRPFLHPASGLLLRRGLCQEVCASTAVSLPSTPPLP